MYLRFLPAFRTTVLSLPLCLALPLTATAQGQQAGPPDVSGPTVRSPVTPQVREENLNTLQQRHRVPQWRKGDPVKIIEDIKSSKI